MLVKRISAILCGVVTAWVGVSSAEASTTQVRIELTSPATSATFATAFFRFINQSSPGISINEVTATSGALFNWDFVTLAAPNAPVDPAGGGRTLLIGEESGTNPNNGCTDTIKYGLTSFNPGDSFTFVADPETAPCQNTVHNMLPSIKTIDTSTLLQNRMGASVTFSDGVTLSGNTWDLEKINPLGNLSLDNRRYVMTLSQTTAAPVPEPETYALLLAGLGLLGWRARQR